MTPRRPRALEIEAYALSTVTGAIDVQPPLLPPSRKFAPPQQTPSRVQAITQWIAIALLVSGIGLEIVLCFAVGSDGLL